MSKDITSCTFPESVNTVVEFFAVIDGSKRTTSFLIVSIFLSQDKIEMTSNTQK